MAAWCITFKAQMKGTMKTQFIGNIYTPTLFEFSIIIIDDRYLKMQKSM